ncbi:MAG: DUF493 family protein [Bacteroidales bacterium]|nr:DUF493 family protein [Bacteroidales bacterium]
MKKNHQINGNGHNKESFAKVQKEEQIKFPVSYHLKAIFLLPEKKEFYLDEMNKLFVSLEIEHKLMDEKLSAKANYISFTFLVHLDNKDRMDKMYAMMNEIEGLKFAL